jgi:hypothetical protein
MTMHSQTELNMAFAIGTHKRAMTKPYNEEGEMVEATFGIARNGTAHNERGDVITTSDIICNTHSAL